MKIKITGIKSGTSELEKEIYQRAAKHVLDTYGKIVPEINRDRNSIGFKLVGTKVVLDEKTLSQSLIEAINKAHTEGRL